LLIADRWRSVVYAAGFDAQFTAKRIFLQAKPGGKIDRPDHIYNILAETGYFIWSISSSSGLFRPFVACQQVLEMINLSINIPGLDPGR
jgi:hypothetical protein